MHFEADETSSPENGEHFDQPNWEEELHVGQRSL